MEEQGARKYAWNVLQTEQTTGRTPSETSVALADQTLRHIKILESFVLNLRPISILDRLGE